MTLGKFVGIIAAVLGATVLLVWILVSVAALIYALTTGDGRAAGIYTGFVLGGLAVGALAWWVATRVAKARATPQ